MKRILLSLMTLVLALALLPQQQVLAKGFSDVTQYEDEINFLTGREIINGFPDGTFKPKNDLTRLQAITMILREKGITDFTAPDPGFTDIKPGNHGYERVAKAVQLGFISGKTDKHGKKYFDAGAPLTRGQMAKILVEGYQLPKTKDVTFEDVPVGNGFKDYISVLASENITTGYLDGSFGPNNKLSRQHFAAFMARMLDDKFKPAPNMQVHFIDVGQGDSILIQSPNGKNMLIDGGDKSHGNKVVAFLKSKGVPTLDVVVATHPDADHIGGLPAVLNNFKVNQFIDSGKAHTTQTYLDLLTLIDKENIPFKVAKTGDVINLDSHIKTTVLYADENASDSNDASIVTRVAYGSVSFLLTGDAEAAIEQKMMSQGNVKSTYLKAGHHGSNTSSSAAFINAVRPVGTILSYGKDNSYGHPHAEVMQRLNAVGSKIYSTAQSGDITVTTNGTTHSVSAKPWTGTVAPKPIEPKPQPKPEPKPAPKPVPKPEPKPTPKPDLGSGLYVIPGAPTSFKNCTEMRKYYPAGVKKGHPAYASKSDRDNDGWACEK
ncbi:S-layer homology domain-containing protein [Sporosarcina sp. 179-K 8C2 HS]|uniref:S-layer homology domain-containing protein n=1 Tax=Sporosarcina sp. 179-K 8C2 HS TaxID=3142387 RepID=UPI0039A015F3